MIKAVPPILVLLACALGSLPAAEPMKIYFIGNSFTMNAKPDRVRTLVEELGGKMDYAAQLSGGKNLTKHRNHAQDAAKTQWQTPAHFDGKLERKGTFGTWETALAKHPWDGVVLQLFPNTLHDDLEAIGAFVETCASNGTCDTFYLYSTWPLRPRPKDSDYALAEFDYSAAWEKDYTATAENTGSSATQGYTTRAYVEKLYTALLAKYPALEGKLHVIPVGEVLYRLDQKIKAGELPEILVTAQRDPSQAPGFREGQTDASAGVGILYGDPLHLQGIGNMVASSTIASVLSGKSPVGLSAKHFGLDPEADAALLEKVQVIIWDTVSSDPRTGVKKP